MNNRVLNITAVAGCLSLLIGCAVPGPRVPILKPQLIEQKAAKDALLSKYCDVVLKTERMGFESASTVCKRVKTGEIGLAAVKSSANGQYVLYLFSERGPAAEAKGGHSIIAFSFNPGSELIRSCSEAGMCDVHVRNGEIRFGHTDVRLHGEPVVTDRGIKMTFSDVPRSYAFDLLFSYREKDKRDGDELITIFLSAFPFLDYQ